MFSNFEDLFNSSSEQIISMLLLFISLLQIPPGSVLGDEADKKEADPRKETPSLRAGGGFI